MCELSPSQGPSNSDWIAENSSGISNAGDIAQSFASERLNNAELMEIEPLDSVVHRPGLVQEALFERDFHSLPPSPCPSATQPDIASSHSITQDWPTADLTPVEMRLRNQEPIRFVNCENESACSDESEDLRMQTAAGQKPYEYASGNPVQRQPAIAQFSLHPAGRQIETVTSTIVRPSRNRLESPVTAQKSSRNSMLAVQERTNSVQGRRSSITRTASKRKRSYGESQYEMISAALEPYLSQEMKKCEKLGLRFPDDRINNIQIRDSLMKFGLDAYADILKCFTFTIGGSESIIILKDMLQAYRSSSHEYLPEPTQKIPNARRLEIIRSLGTNEAYFNLLRKCHVHRLFIENTGSSRNANDKFLVSTIESVTSRARRNFGNPLNVAEAEITKAMMKEIYPNVSLNSTDYDTKYREISQLRRLGRRLDMLVSIFGLGILGLLPLRKGDSTTELASSITNNLYVPPFSLRSLLD